MAGLDPGRLDRRIIVERARTIDDGYAARLGDWVPLVEVWAEFRPGRGSERFEAAVRAAAMPAAFWIRWSPDVSGVTPADRVRFDGRVWAITAVTEIGRREGLELMCQASDDGSSGDSGGA